MAVATIIKQAPASAMADPLTDPFSLQRARRRWHTLRNEQWSYRHQWRDIRDLMSPRSGRYLFNDRDEMPQVKGRAKGRKIINSVASDSKRTLGAGMQGGLSSPARPWFVMRLPDPDLSNYPPVAEWLTDVRDTILLVMARSNFYDSQHRCYEELGLFGTTAMLIEPDFRTIARCRPFTIGEFCLSLDSTYRPDTLYRQLSMTASQIQAKFGKDQSGKKVQLPATVRVALMCGNADVRFEVVHAIEPNLNIDTGKADYRGMAYISFYFLQGGGEDGVLRRSGYKTIPFVAPRWDVVGTDTYGNDCPGMIALGDAGMLQKMEEKSLKALDKFVDPPMNAPASMRSNGGTIVPGGVNYIDNPQLGGSFVPAYQINPNLTDIGNEKTRVEQRIQRCFYNDLFLSLINETKRMTATEVAQRYEEKLMMLGPVLERLQGEGLDPVVERYYAIIEDAGGFPPPPPELAGQTISVQYTSMLAQAQKMVGTEAIEQAAQAAASFGPVEQVNPRFDSDEATKEYMQMLGVSPKLIRSDAQVAQMKAAQQKAAQMQQMAMAAAPAGQGIKNMAAAQQIGQQTQQQ